MWTLLLLVQATLLALHCNAFHVTTSGYSVAGSDPDRPQKVNQDSWFAIDSAPSFVCLGIMDGHGTKGHQVTEYLKEQLPKRITEQMELNGAIPDSDQEIHSRFLNNLHHLANFHPPSYDKDYPVPHCLVNAFHLAHIDALEAKGVPAARSGTTCAVALLVQEDNIINNNSKYHLYSAFVGDSRGILIHADGSSKCIAYSTTTNIPSERERIQRGEGRVDEQGNVWYGPVAIAMTRSLGNGVMIRSGIIPTPIVEYHGVIQVGSTVALVTDGVSDVSGDTDLATLLNARSVLEPGICNVCESATEKWQAGLSIECKVDDITCVAARIS